MNQSSGNAFMAVFKREILRMVSRRFYYGTTIILPLFTLLFMSTIFKNGQMENIPVGVVDLDNTPTSRQIIRNVDAVPTFDVTLRFSNPADARDATVRKDIYGYLVIPQKFEQDMYDQKYTTLNYYYHYALLSVGSEVLSGYENILELAAAAPVMTAAASTGLSEGQIKGVLLPVTNHDHPLSNPNMNYSIYLSNPFFFVLFQILILLITLYSMGNEINNGTAPEWLATAKGNIVTAIAGKLCPYTIVFTVITVFANYIFFGPLQLPYNSSLFPLILSSVLVVTASQALSVFVFSIYPNMGIIISIISMLGSLGATLAGVTFPPPAMHPLVHYISYLFPIRHYFMINENILHGNFGFAYSWYNYVILFCYILPVFALLPHFRKVIISRRYEEK